MLNVYPVIRDKDKIESRLILKYGKEVVNDFKMIVNDYNLTLTEIGKRYDFSKEWARQLFKIVNGYSYSQVLKSKAFAKKVDCVIRKIDPVERAKKSKANYMVSAQSELAVYEICKSMGFDIIPKRDGKIYSFIINGYNVAVKVSSQSKCYTDRMKAEYYRFNLSKSQLIEIDYMICHVVPDDDFYIIPTSMLAKSGTMYIRNKKTGINMNKNSQCNNVEQYRNFWAVFDVTLQEAAQYKMPNLINEAASKKFVQTLATVVG